MNQKDVESEDGSSEIAKIFLALGNLFEEVRIEGCHFKIPIELRSEKKNSFSLAETDELIMMSLATVYQYALILVDQLRHIDPNFFKVRLELFFEEWEKAHLGWNLKPFYYLKFLLESHIDFS